VISRTCIGAAPPSCTSREVEKLMDAARIGVPRTRMERIAKEETGITVDT
jgi:hypothetical protein